MCGIDKTFVSFHNIIITMDYGKKKHQASHHFRSWCFPHIYFTISRDKKAGKVIEAEAAVRIGSVMAVLELCREPQHSTAACHSIRRRLQSCLGPELGPGGRGASCSLTSRRGAAPERHLYPHGTPLLCGMLPGQDGMLFW